MEIEKQTPNYSSALNQFRFESVLLTRTEVKFHCFRPLKLGEERTIPNFLFRFP